MFEFFSTFLMKLSALIISIGVFLGISHPTPPPNPLTHTPTQKEIPSPSSQPSVTEKKETQTKEEREIT